MTRPRRDARKPRWETNLLAMLATPANIVLGGTAAFLLSLGVITALPAMIALGRAFTRWHRDGDDAVFTNTFREFAATWRRSLLLGLFAAFVVIVLAADVIFLFAQWTTGSDNLALLFAAAAIPVGVVFMLMLLALPVAASRYPNAERSEWLQESMQLLLRHPVQSLLVLFCGTAVTVGCTLLPTLIPFLALSLPTYAAVRIWGYRADADADAAE